MPFRTSSISGLALVVAFFGALVLSGCSTATSVVDGASRWWSSLGKQTTASPAPAGVPLFEPEPAAPPAGETSVSAPAQARPYNDLDPILTYWETIEGGLAGPASKFGKALDVVTGGDLLRLSQPTALAVRDQYLYVVDVGLELVLRIDRITQRVERMVELRGFTVGAVSDIFVAPDLTFYLTDTDGARVLQFDARGRLLRTFQSRLNMVRPVAVALLDSTNDVLVADGEFDHVLVFQPDGTLVSAFGGRGNEPGQFLNVTTLAKGPDGFYVGARVGQRIQALSPDGRYLYSFPQETVTFPLAMAADDEFRVFVGDYLDNSIKVYERGRFIASIGGTGVGPGSFKRITDLWVDHGFLYVADSLNSRIQVLRIAAAATSILEP